MGGASVVAEAPQVVQAPSLDILFGTQTGNAEFVAEDAMALAKSKGFALRMAELDAIDMAQLAVMERAIIIVSTYGEGEMPDNAQAFWDALSATDDAPRLENLSYGVLGLSHMTALRSPWWRLIRWGAGRVGTICCFHCQKPKAKVVDSWAVSHIIGLTLGSGPMCFLSDDYS